jgi:starvation-inducible outer membrane lipoprotein
MKIILTSLAALTLAGCASLPAQVVTKTELQVYVPDRSMFYCQNVRRFPNPETLTDTQVAKLLVELHSKNTECQKNMNAIYKVLDEAKKKADENKEAEQKK